jgi:tetratricopeptide (TPR) repeat protein
MVFAVDRSHGNPEGVGLTEHERRVLPLIDGKRSVREVVEESGLLEFDGCKAIFELVQAGFLRNRGRKREAAPDETRPGRVQEHRNLGVAFYRTSMFEEAEREFLKVLEIEPANREAQFLLGSIALRQRQPRPAMRRLMRLIETGGGTASSFHNLALALELSARLEDASLAVDAALRDFPRDRPLLLARAILLTRRGEFTAGCEAFAAYEAERDPSVTSPDPASYYAYSVVALGGAGRLVAAMSRAREGVSHYPRNPQLLVNAAAAHERSGDIETAESLYERATEEAPEIPQARRGLADALYRRGAYEEAGAIYERLVRAGDVVSPEVLFKLGNIAYKHGDRARALSYWRETVDADPGHAVARTNLELVEGTLDVIET